MFWDLPFIYRWGQHPLTFPPISCIPQHTIHSTSTHLALYNTKLYAYSTTKYYPKDPNPFHKTINTKCTWGKPKTCRSNWNIGLNEGLLQNFALHMCILLNALANFHEDCNKEEELRAWSLRLGHPHKHKPLLLL